jgi:hypothetical protein
LTLGAAVTVFLLSAGCAGPATSDANARRDYIEARARYSRTMDSLYKVSPAEALKADSAAVRDLAGRLRAILGTFSMPGVTDTGTINLGTLISGSTDTDLPDGITYRGPDSIRIFVADSAIFHAWISQRYHSRVPAELAGALKAAEVNTFVFWEEAAVVRYADLPATSTRKQVYTAQLINRAQDDCVECTPEWILVTVGVDFRVIIADTPVPDRIPVPGACRQAAFDYWKANPRGDEGFARALRCYENAMKSDPRFPGLVAKAQSLIDALPSNR